MRKVLALGFALSVLFVLCFVVSQSSAQEKVIVLKYTNFFPAPHANSIIADQWCKEVEKRTNGQTKKRKEEPMYSPCAVDRAHPFG